MAASWVPTFMTDLHRCLLPVVGQSDADSGQHAAKVADNLLRACGGQFGKTSLVNVASVLFDEHDGLLEFLRKSAPLLEFTDSKVKLLKCLSWFLTEKVGSESEKRAVIQPYALDIKNVLLSLFFQGRRAQTKNAVIPVLITILQLFAGTSIGEQLEPKTIMDKFFEQLALPTSKTPSTVQQNIYHLLGIIAKTYPEFVVNVMNRLLTVYLNNLQQQFVARKPDMCVITGCLFGLNALLSSYPSAIDDKIVADMFNCTMKCIRYDENIKRYDHVRGGFDLFISQSSRFKVHIYSDYANIHNSLEKWIRMGKGGREMANYAYQVTDIFFRNIASVLTAKVNADKNDLNAKAVFVFFMEKFSNEIKSGDFSRSVAMSVKGYGYFAAPCSFIVNKEEVKAMYNIVLPICERIFCSEVSDAIVHLPSFIEAVASIIEQLDGASDISLLSIENMVIYMVEYFPRFHPSHHFLCYHAIIKIIVAVYQKGAIFKTFLGKIVFQSILRTCSHPIVAESGAHGIDDDDQVAVISVDESDIKQTSYKNYMDLWKNILEAVILKEFNDIGVSLESRHAVTNAVYDEIIHSVLTVLKRLDFTSTKVADGVAANSFSAQPTSDPVEGLRASRPKDFQIFVNIVDFCRNLLLERHVLLFEKWVYKFSYDVIVLSTKFPLVSGFYKLLATCFRICSKIKYFYNLDASIVDSEKLAAFDLFVKHIKEVTVRLRQYKEDLLISCLHLVLSLPNEIVQTQMPLIIPAVELTFKLGVGYHPLVEDGLDALEIWRSGLQVDIMCPLYKRILPLLNNYLKTLTVIDEEGGHMQNAVQRKTTKERMKLAVNVVEKKIATKKGSRLSEISRVKSRIVQLIGKLGNTVNHHLIDCDSETVAKKAIAWDTIKHLRFDVPFIDMKPYLFFDDFLPKVVELALLSTNRQTKVAAAELLHALVLYMLGTSTTKTAALQKKEPITKLYVKIFPVLLQLSCDADRVVRQLFEPLIMQLIHWLSKNRACESCNTEALLNALLDGVGSDTDSALRDFCARCIKEFMVWTIKQMTPQSLEKNPFNTKALLKRLYHLSLHPKSSLRLGAALTFNSIYVVLRDEDSLVGQFMLEILVNFVESLAMSQMDDPHLGTREQCKEALNHVERILQVKSSLFNKVDKKRRLPNGFAKGDLEEAVLWLLRQCGRIEEDCRHHCMNMVFNLAPHIKGTPTVNHFFQQLINDRGAQFFVLQFEGDASRSREQLSLNSSPTLEVHCDDETFVTAAQNWFSVLLASLDCYFWVLDIRLMTPRDFFSGSTTTVLVKAIVFFLNNFPQPAGKHGQRLTDRDIHWTPREVAAYNRVACMVFVRIVDFVQVVATGTAEFNVIFLRELLIPRFWKLLVAGIIRPTSLGFDMSDTEIMEALPKKMSGLLSVLSKGIPSISLLELRDAVAIDISDKSLSLNLSDMLPKISKMKLSWVSKLGHLVSGYQILHSVKVLLPALKMDNPRDQSAFAERLLLTACELCFENSDGLVSATDLNGGRLDVAKKLLHLSLSLQLSIPELIGVISKKDPICKALDQVSIPKGELFFTNFKTEILIKIAACAPNSVEYIMECFEEDPAHTIKIILDLLEHLLTDKEQRIKCGSEVVLVVARNLPKIQHLRCSTADNTCNTELFHILMKLISIHPKVSSDVRHPAFSIVFDIYLNFLIDTKTSLQFKGKLLDLLPCFANLPEVPLLLLKKRLVVMTSNSFPLRSAEYPEGSVKSQEYKIVFKKLLWALVSSSSAMILELLIEMIATESKHVCEDNIQESLISFIKRVPLEQHSAVLSIPFRLFIDEQCNPDNIRRCALQRVAIPLLKHVNKVSLLAFFVENVTKIMACLTTKPTKVSDPKFVSKVITRIGCFQLMEVLYSRCTKEDISSPQSSVNHAFYGDSEATGKELTKELTSVAHSAKKENMRGETLHLEIRRIHCCVAYKTLAAIIICTQTELKFYSVFLFTENVNKGDFLWDNLVDSQRTYEFEIEFKTILEKKDQLIGIRRKAKASQLESDGNDDDDYGSYPLSFHRLTSQNLADSSLSEEASQFDFTSSPQFMSSVGDTSYKKIPAENITAYSEGGAEIIRLEMDELNKHECMVVLTFIVRHMNGLCPPTTSAESSSEMPLWMKNLHSKISNDATCTNIKLFIAKLVFNSSQVFGSYAKFWLYPLMKLITSGACGTGITYFTVDMIITMLSWHEKAVPQDTVEREAADDLLKFLINNAFYHRAPIMRNNLEIIKSVIECWKSCLKIPTGVIFDNFRDTDKEKTVNQVGIQVLGLVLSNGFPPYTSVIGLDRERFFGALISNLTNTKGDVYKCAAEVLGLALKHFSKADSSDDFLSEMLRKKLVVIKQSGFDRFITCLYWIQKNHPPFADSFLSQVRFNLSKVHGIFKTQCLEVILSRLELLENVFIEMKQNSLFEMLTKGDDAVKHLCLKIIDNMLYRLTKEQVQTILQEILVVSDDPNANFRRQVFEILFWIYDNFCIDVPEDATSESIVTQCKTALLKGLADKDESLRLSVLNFWSDSARMPTKTIERSIAILRTMYSPVSEKNFLSYATNLLLELTSKSPDFKRKIHEHPLSHCEFQEYNVDTSWRARHSTMMPLFVETITLSSQQEFLASAAASMQGGQLRATQNVSDFTATQDMQRSFNWLTQSTMDTTDMELSSSDATAPPSSTLLFTVGTGSPSRKKRFSCRSIVDPNFGKSKLSAPNEPDDSDQKSHYFEIQRLRKRFTVESHSAIARHAVIQAKQKQRREQLAREQKLARVAKVTMYRQYRTGDFPDIQITYSAIIAPLQALAQGDDSISKMLFKSLFLGILRYVKENEEETGSYAWVMADVKQSINRILSETTLCYPPVISVVQEIGFEHCGEMPLDIENVASTATTSFQQNTAILLLEKMILEASVVNVDESKRAKRARIDSATLHKAHWFKLAELNKSQGTVDVSRGIFAYKVGCHSDTREALDAETRGNYAAALKVYERVTADSSQIVEEMERALWDDAIIQCYDQLSHWGDLQNHVMRKIDNTGEADLQKVWDDLNYQKQYLPHLVRSKVRLIMQGEMDQSLTKFIDATFLDSLNPERKELLQTNHCEELALLSIVQESYNQARVYGTACVQRFLDDWASMSDLAVVHLRSRLCDLQKLIEMNNFLDVVILEGDRFMAAVSNLAERWEQNCPDTLVNISVTDNIVANRCMFLKILERKIGNHSASMQDDSEEISDLKCKLHKSKLATLMSCVEAASTQNNFSVAMFRLKESYKVAIKMNDAILMARWRHVYVRTHLQRSKIQDVNNRINSLSNIWNQLKKIDSNKSVLDNPALLVEHHLLHSRVADALSVFVTEHEESVSSSYFSSMLELLSCNSDAASSEVLTSLMKHSFEHLKSTVSVAFSPSDPEDRRRSAEANLQLANYCDVRLRKADDGHADRELFPELVAEFPDIFMRSLLDAMRLGSQGAMQLFPRLLEVVEKYLLSVDLFQEKVKEVPCWMFIRWISQMVALLDKPVAPMLKYLVMDIAKQYPQALVYPFKVSSQGYSFEKNADGRRNASAVNEIRAVLSNLWLVDNFVSALEELKNPFVDCNEFLNKILLIMKSKGNREACLKIFSEMQRKHFLEPLKQPLKEVPAVPVGKFGKMFANDMGKLVEGHFGCDGSKLLTMSFQDFLDHYKTVVTAMKSVKFPSLLKDYCDWFSSYRSSAFSMELELPGQYTGLQKPTAEYHTKIAKFDDKVHVLESVQKPKAITVYGNDYKTYRFLVKGGEDLRLDQRIQQLFQVMNEVYATDPACAVRQLKLATYQVTPVSNKLGLLEWVENTTTLKGFLFKTPEQDKVRLASRSVVFKWIVGKRGLGKANPDIVFAALYLHNPKNEVVKQYNEAVASIPENLLKNAFLDLSSSLESFLTLRTHFIISHAVLCVSQYILGIGDRHLDNFIVSLETGGMVGIDFGHSFGSATQILPVPELIPFRLTPQFLNLMKPMREHGLLMATMIHALGALRKSPTKLLNTMDIFIKEPSLDWKEAALRVQGHEASEDANVTWYPRQKVEFARRKLNGHDSRDIMADELELRNTKREAHHKMVEICLGGARLTGVVSVEDQVSRLLEHAMDPDILSRTFFGWDSAV